MKRSFVVVDDTTKEVVEAVPSWVAGDRLATHLTRTTLRLHVIETVTIPPAESADFESEAA